MKTTPKTSLGFAVLALAFSASALAQTPMASTNITAAEVEAAQKAWGEALVSISRTFEAQGFDKAKALASNVLDSAYGYSMGPVLFKPTLTEAPQTFRTTKDGALAYFVGGDAKYPKDGGFALKGWRKVDVSNVGMQLHGNTAIVQGNVSLTDKNGKITTVDKTFGYVKDSNGALKIVLHHSSLPYSAK